MPRRIFSTPHRPKLIVCSLVALATCALGAGLVARHSFGTQDSIEVTERQRERVETYMRGTVLRWLSEPLLRTAVTAQNVENADLTDVEIDARDRAWRSDVAEGGSPAIEAMLDKPLSMFLRQQQAASDGLVAEIIVTDNQGLNVAQSTVSTDLWQGDEAKFTRTYGNAEDFVLIEKPEIDESTQRRQIHASMPIADANGRPIGVITLGIDLEALARRGP